MDTAVATERKSHGIMFKAEMVRAILNTRVGSWPAEPIDASKPFKWQTRRIVKPQPILRDSPIDPGRKCFSITISPGSYRMLGAKNFCDEFAQHKVGTELWVRETWQYAKDFTCMSSMTGTFPDRDSIVYRAQTSLPAYQLTGTPWRSAMLMPRVASRITLEVKSVRIERRDSISEADAIAESFKSPADFLAYVASMKRDGPKNPWCWVYSFVRTK